MAIRPIVITGNPVLHTRAQEVTVFDDELRTLVADMYDTMDKAPGVGLAAPQIGVPLRIFVYDYADDDGNERRGVIINPSLTISEVIDEPADEDTEVEGCLSVPGERFPLKRAEFATVTGVDLDQNPVHIEADGWFARIFQHEFDHLDGTLYVDRLAEPWKTISVEVIEDNGWGVDGKSWLPGRDNLEG
ncbi:MAG: peptide deformylase [Actinomycetales bacterium]|nr:peptide deformylase [Actinomycetales bacterium]